MIMLWLSFGGACTEFYFLFLFFCFVFVLLFLACVTIGLLQINYCLIEWLIEIDCNDNQSDLFHSWGISRTGTV